MARHGENIRKRADGRWEARLLFGKNKEGKAVYKYFYGRSYKEAKEKRNQAGLRQQRISYIDADKDTVISSTVKPMTNSDILFDQLLSDWLFFIKPQVKESTFAKYQFYVSRHISPLLGSYPLCRITTDVIDMFSTEKLMNRKLKGKGGLSPKMVNSLLSIIKQALVYGQERGIYLTHLAKIHNARETLPEIIVFPKSEQDTLETYLVNNMCYITLGILLSLFTGLRIGEVCGLKWEDISID